MWRNVKALSAVNKALDALGWGPYSTYPTNMNLSCGGAPMNTSQAVVFAGDMCQWKRDAIAGVKFWTSKTANSQYQDLAKGCGGDFRYVEVTRGIPGAAPVTALFLLRSSSAQTVYPGYAGMTPDINQGRGGTCLYLIWRIWMDYPPSPATAKSINGH